MALFSKEQTISETSIANKFRLERERDMEMLQNRFPFKVSSTNFFIQPDLLDPILEPN